MPVLAGDVDDEARSTSAGSAAATAVVHAAHGLRAAEDHDEPLARRDAEPLARRQPVDRRHVADRRAGHEAALGRGSAAQVASNETASAEASRAVARTLRPGTTLPSQSSVGMPRSRAARSTGIAT